MMRKAEKEQVDLLAHEPFEDGKRQLQKARHALVNNYKPQIVLDHAAIAKAYLHDADKAAMQHRSYSSRILAARQSALNAGLRNSDELVKGLADIDDDLRDESDLFSDPLPPAEFSKFQRI